MTQAKMPLPAADSDLAETEVLSIASISSLDFLDAAFDCYGTGQVFAISRPDTDLDGLVGGVHVIDLPATPRRGWATPAYRPNHSDAPAQIVFTSGTEGWPKPIVLSHRNLADVVGRLNDIMQVTGEIREYIGVPVTYSFGLGRARAVAAAGGAIFLPERFDPTEIRTLLEAGEINAISAVPSLWQMVLANPEAIGAVGAKVRWIEIGSQYMSGADKAATKLLFPKARIVQHYGLTEASRTTFLDISANDGAALESVGSATGQAAVRIGEDGAICIRGDHVALGQLGAGGQITPLTDADGWLVTKDRGELRDGQLYYLGRLDDQINVAGIKLAAEALEREISALVPGATGGFAVTSVPDRMRGDAVLLALEKTLGDSAPLVEAAAKIALERRGIAVGKTAASVLRVQHLDALPRTGTNKIRRAALRDLHQDSAAPAGGPGEMASGGVTDTKLSPAEARVADIWRRVVGPAEMQPDETFYDVGGDSLSSVQIGLVMESAGVGRPAIRATLEGRSIAEVARLNDQGQAAAPSGQQAQADLPAKTVKSWAISATRAVMAFSVLVSHWGPGFFGRFGLEEGAERLLSIYYRMGTPGFAMVFGIGVGFFMLPGFAEKRGSVSKRFRSAFLLVFFGLSLMAASSLILDHLRGLPFDGQRLSFAFYGVLAYYSIMLGTGPLWLAQIARLRDPVVVLPALAILSWIGLQIVRATVPAEMQNGILEWFRLMTIAGYSVLKLSAMALVGIAAGFWLSGHQDLRLAARRLIVIGGLGGLVSILQILQIFGSDVFTRRDDAVFGSLQGLTLYAFLSLLILGLCLYLIERWKRNSGLLKLALKALIALGGLALPVYAFHQLVVPTRDILVLSGVSGGLALVIPMGVFLALIGFGWRHLYRLYFE